VESAIDVSCKNASRRLVDAEVIERMKALRRDGLAVDKVAGALNSEGLKPRAGRIWYATSVYRVLKVAGGL